MMSTLLNCLLRKSDKLRILCRSMYKPVTECRNVKLPPKLSSILQAYLVVQNQRMRILWALFIPLLNS